MQLIWLLMVLQILLGGIIAAPERSMPTWLEWVSKTLAGQLCAGSAATSGTDTQLTGVASLHCDRAGLCHRRTVPGRGDTATAVCCDRQSTPDG